MSSLNLNILLIEDDLQTRRFLKSSLTRRDWNVIEADSGKTGLMLLKSNPPNLLILDLSLPDMDGIMLIKRLRQFSDLPVLVLSARSLEQSKIMALEMGADDYLTKPFGIGELNARLQALLRRISKICHQEPFETGDLTIDLSKRKVFIVDREIKISPTEYHILSVLVRNAGLVVTQRQLLKEIWGADHLEDNHYLRVYMRQLRHKLEINPARPRYLLTETGIGYRLSDS